MKTSIYALMGILSFMMYSCSFIKKTVGEGQCPYDE